MMDRRYPRTPCRCVLCLSPRPGDGPTPYPPITQSTRYARPTIAQLLKNTGHSHRGSRGPSTGDRVTRHRATPEVASATTTSGKVSTPPARQTWPGPGFARTSPLTIAPRIDRRSVTRSLRATPNAEADSAISLPRVARRPKPPEVA